MKECCSKRQTETLSFFTAKYWEVRKAIEWLLMDKNCSCLCHFSISINLNPIIVTVCRVWLGENIYPWKSIEWSTYSISSTLNLDMMICKLSNVCQEMPCLQVKVCYDCIIENLAYLGCLCAGRHHPTYPWKIYELRSNFDPKRNRGLLRFI